MPVNPLDLQVNFSQMNHVGRQVSHDNEADAVRQGVAGMTIQKEGKKNAEEVPQIAQNDKDYAKIKDKKHRQNDQQNPESNEEEENEDVFDENEETEQKQEKKNPYGNPYLGHKIDVMG